MEAVPERICGHVRVMFQVWSHDKQHRTERDGSLDREGEEVYCISFL